MLEIDFCYQDRPLKKVARCAFSPIPGVFFQRGIRPIFWAPTDTDSLQVQRLNLEHCCPFMAKATDWLSGYDTEEKSCTFKFHARMPEPLDARSGSDRFQTALAGSASLPSIQSL